MFTELNAHMARNKSSLSSVEQAGNALIERGDKIGKTLANDQLSACSKQGFGCVVNLRNPAIGINQHKRKGESRELQRRIWRAAQRCAAMSHWRGHSVGTVTPHHTRAIQAAAARRLRNGS